MDGDQRTGVDRIVRRDRIRSLEASPSEAKYAVEYESQYPANHQGAGAPKNQDRKDEVFSPG